MRINHNISSMVAQGTLFSNNGQVSKNLEKLSTGLRINRSADDAAGLAISEKFRAQVKGTAMAKKNALDGISAINVAEGAANEIHSVLQRMRELSVQSATDTMTSTDRGYTNQEFSALRSEIDRIATVTNFNGMKLLAGGTAARLGSGGTNAANLWVDANNTYGGDSITVTIDTLSADTNGLSLTDDSLTTQSTSVAAISALDQAIGSVNTMRSNMGAYVNRLETSINNLTLSNTNQQAAESQIRDLDFAQESAAFSKNQILSQSATSMLAQANQRSQGVMQLLG